MTDKHISNTHEKFKEFASILAKLVKKIFIEFHDPGKKSISAELMKFATLMVTQVVINGQDSDEVYRKTKEFLQKKSSFVKPINCMTESYSCSSLSLIQQPEVQVLSENNSASKNLFALRENLQSGKKKFGSESNISNSVLKAKRQISF